MPCAAVSRLSYSSCTDVFAGLYIASTRAAEFPLFNYTTMPPPTPSQSPNGRLTRSKELTPYLRRLIFDEYMRGRPPAVIARRHGNSESTVRYTIKMQSPRGVDQAALQVCRSPKLSALNMCAILKCIRRNPFMSYDDMRLESGKSVSDKVFLRTLRASGYERKGKKWIRITDRTAGKL
ncbi:hypothetical protein N7481_006733 [Penicillium waksmanii]|uniref:uncharacterized protein n=1 Tax=Penicillium waksmanii TaxID=69791 RepID=UPI0025473966|nr:uncharacterized protein N7481_006733 [Penicillium waksmanii]KAJ5984634.1 hypothetical protein N7481_006733 [Penicillium waksmanii]